VGLRADEGGKAEQGVPDQHGDEHLAEAEPGH
jgi:hypothetical protein